MLRISALALVLSMMGPSLATAACPAFTHLDNTLLTPPPEVTPSGNPLHYREWVYQEFPAYGLQHVNSVSAWAVHLIQHSVNATHANQVLAIDRAIYITTEGKRIEVLRGLWPQQIIVPYAQSSDVVYDLLSNPPLLSLTDNEAALAPCGELGPAIYPRNWAAARNDLAPPGSPRSIYVKEIGDVGMENASYNGYGRGIAERPPEMRRGSELVLWAVSDSDNYDNIIAYHFRDDGEVTALLGPTGWNTTVGPPARVKSGNTPHAHTVLWLMRPAVADRHGGQDIGIVEYNQHVDQDGKTTEHYSVEPVTTERRVVFDAAKFTRLRISDPESFNDPAPGKPAQENEYVMTLISDGTPRHRLTASDDNSAPRFDFAIVVDRVSEHTAEPFPSKRYDSLDDLLDDESDRREARCDLRLHDNRPYSPVGGFRGPPRSPGLPDRSAGQSNDGEVERHPADAAQRLYARTLQPADAGCRDDRAQPAAAHPRMRAARHRADGRGTRVRERRHAIPARPFADQPEPVRETSHLGRDIGSGDRRLASADFNRAPIRSCAVDHAGSGKRRGQPGDRRAAGVPQRRDGRRRLALPERDAMHQGRRRRLQQLTDGTPDGIPPEVPSPPYPALCACAWMRSRRAESLFSAER